MNMPFRDTECHLAHPGAFLCPTERSTLVRRLSQARPGSIHSETQGGSHLSLPRKAARGSFLQDTEFCSPQSLFLPEDSPASGKKWLRGEHDARTGSEAAHLAGPAVPHFSAGQEEAQSHDFQSSIGHPLTLSPHTGGVYPSGVSWFKSNIP